MRELEFYVRGEQSSLMKQNSSCHVSFRQCPLCSLIKYKHVSRCFEKLFLRVTMGDLMSSLVIVESPTKEKTIGKK